MILDIAYNYWVYFGTFYLLILTIQDYRNKRVIDDRFNYLMLGVSISLYSHIQRTLGYMVIIIALIIVWTILLKKFKAIGEGDISSLSWIWIGFGIINHVYLVWYIALFSICMIIYTFFKSVVFKQKKPTPFFYVILLSFVLTNILFGLY